MFMTKEQKLKHKQTFEKLDPKQKKFRELNSHFGQAGKVDKEHIVIPKNRQYKQDANYKAVGAEFQARTKATTKIN